jgi:hypothetical protein
MVTIAIMGIAFVAILTGVAIAITASDSHRQEATAEGVVRSFAERVIDPKDTPYVPCASTGDYQSPSGFELPPGWSASVTSVAYLQPGDPPQAYGGGCPSPDLGAQQITLQVSSPQGRHAATEMLVAVKRARTLAP